MTTPPLLMKRRALTPSGSPVPPIAGPLAWWDASQITGVADAATLSSWPDSSGNGHTLTQATGAKQPTYYKTTSAKLINGKPAVWFDGANTSMTATAIAQASPYTWVAYCQAVPKPPSENFIASCDGFTVAMWETGTSWEISQSSADNEGVADASLHMIAGVFNSTSSILAVDGSLKNPANLGAAVNMSGTFNFAIANAIATTQWSGPIVEFLIYASALSTGQLATCRSYGQTKWGTP